MPRINVTDEELKVLERFRQKYAGTLGYNEAITVVVRIIGTFWPGPTQELSVSEFRVALSSYIESLHRELPQ